MAELFLLNDAPRAIGPLEVVVHLHAGSSTRLGAWTCPGSAAGTNCAGPVMRGVVPPCTGETFELIVEVIGQPELSSRYTLAFSRTK